ncbi:MAG: hypothetical protein ACPGXL_08180, partial [Chitinophagales bacterium]
MPQVQSFLTVEGIHYLEKKLDVEISTDSVYVDIFNDIYIENLYIEDWDCDTLLFAKTLTIDISELALISGRIAIRHIEVEQPYVNIYRKCEEDDLNIQYLIDALKNPSSPTDITDET